MKNKIITILGILALSFSINSCTVDTCDNGVKDGTETAVDCGGDCTPCVISSTVNVNVNGTGQTVSNTIAELGNQFYASINSSQAHGLGLAVTFRLSDNSTVSVGFYNDDISADCLSLGAHTTDLESAFAANEFKYGKVIVTNSQGYFLSEGASDVINLVKCDRPNKLFSANFNATVFNSSSGDSLTVSGSFTDVEYIVSF